MTREFTRNVVTIRYNNGQASLTGTVLSSDNVGVDIEYTETNTSTKKKFFIPWTSIKSVEYLDGK